MPVVTIRTTKTNLTRENKARIVREFRPGELSFQQVERYMTGVFEGDTLE